MIIKRFSFKDIDRAAMLHSKTLSQTPLSKLGQRYLRLLYERITLEPTIGFVIYDKKRLIGVITATTDLKQTQKRLPKRFVIFVIFLLIKNIFLGKLQLNAVIRRLSFDFLVLKIFKNPYSTILTLFIDKDFRRQGMGKYVTCKVLNEMKKKGVRKVYVDTLIENKKALIFYKKLGFKRERRLTDSIILSFNLDTQRLDKINSNRRNRSGVVKDSRRIKIIKRRRDWTPLFVPSVKRTF